MSLPSAPSTATPVLRAPARWGVQTMVLLAALLCLSLVLAMGGLGLGATGWSGLVWPGDEAVMSRIVWDIRAPRALAAWSAGLLLGLAGALAQGLFRNPLADPFLLGSAPGAALAVALFLALGGEQGLLSRGLSIGLTMSAFVGAVGAVMLTLLLSRGVQQTLRLLLAGVVVGVVLGAMTSLVGIVSPAILQSMQTFMLGSTAHVAWSGAVFMAATAAVLTAVAVWVARVLDLLALGEQTALSLGLSVGPWRLCLIALLALATGTAVAQCGLIAFVGLVAPHLVRSLVKVTHGPLVLLSALMGGVLLLSADTLARSLMAPQELPVGVLTAVLGGGYLLWLMGTRR